MPRALTTASGSQTAGIANIMTSAPTTSRVAQAYNKIVTNRDIGQSPYNAETAVPTIAMMVEDQDTGLILIAVVAGCAEFIFQYTEGGERPWMPNFRARWVLVQ